MRSLLLFLTCHALNFANAYEVLTIGDSIVDYILTVDKDYVNSLPGERGGSALIDDVLFQQIIKESGVNPLVRPGGSAVNMIKGMHHLGHDCALISTIGSDAEGEFFLKSLKDHGVVVFVENSVTPTGKSACLVTSDGERTMRTFLGASKDNGRMNLSPEMFDKMTHFHLEGYQLKHRKLIKNAIALARENGATISMDMASFQNVNAQKEFIWKLLENRWIDILFANEEEAFALTGLGPKDASDFLANYCEISVVTMGEGGCYATTGQQQWHCKAFPVKVVDTIGAGDLFMSGFLHGYLTDLPIPVCAKLGNLVASHVVQVLGAEISLEQWASIKSQISEAGDASPGKGKKRREQPSALSRL